MVKETIARVTMQAECVTCHKTITSSARISNFVNWFNPFTRWVHVETRQANCSESPTALPVKGSIVEIERVVEGDC